MRDIISWDEEPEPCPRARDQRLLEFAQGGWGDVAAWSGWLVLQADDVSPPRKRARAKFRCLPRVGGRHGCSPF